MRREEDSGEREEPGSGDSSNTTSPRKLCTCYCLVSWIAPINPANSDVPDANQPTITGVTTQTETEVGSEFWTANVNVKTYDCATSAVVGTAATVLNLAKFRYSITRTRNLVFGVGVKTVWGIPLPYVTITWSAWSAPVRTVGAQLSDADALATSSPPSTPMCTDVGIACP